MIDFYIVFGGLDRMCAAIAKAMEPKPKKKKKKKMANKPLNISEVCSCADADENRSIVNILVAMGVFAYTELTSRLVSLETSRELFENDLLKKIRTSTLWTRSNIFY